MTGAYTAGREGLSTILVESSDRFGGTTAYSGGGMWFPCSAALKRAGVHEELADAAEYYKEVVGTRTSPVLQDQYLTTGRKVIDYLEEDSDLFFVIYPWADYYERAAKSPAHRPRAAECGHSRRSQSKAASDPRRGAGGRTACR